MTKKPSPETIAEAQRLLRTINPERYGLGESGANQDGVDGDPGWLTKGALAQFEKDYRLSPKLPLEDVVAEMRKVAAKPATFKTPLGEFAQPEDWKKIEETARAIGNVIGPDPKKLLIMSFDRNDPIKNSKIPGTNAVIQSGDYISSEEMMASGEFKGRMPVIHFLQSARKGVDDPGETMRVIEAQVRKHGTLDMLMIGGHGFTNNIGMQLQSDTRDILREIAWLQAKLTKENSGRPVRIAKRIELGGCRVFADLSKEDVREYKQYAHDLDADIVASTTRTYGKAQGGLLGHFYRFSPDGTVQQDHDLSPDSLKAREEFWNEQARKSKQPVFDIASDEKWLTEKPLKIAMKKESVADYMKRIEPLARHDAVFTLRVGLTEKKDIFTLFDKLQKLQDKLTKEKGGMPFQITYELELTGDRVFADLTPQEIERFKKAARDLNMDISGATTAVLPHAEVGHFVKFTPQGTIEDDTHYYHYATERNKSRLAQESGQDLSKDERWLASEMKAPQTPGNNAHAFKAGPQKHTP